MNKNLLAATCAATFAIGTALGASSYAQNAQPNDQPNAHREKMRPDSERMSPGLQNPRQGLDQSRPERMKNAQAPGSDRSDERRSDDQPGFAGKHNPASAADERMERQDGATTRRTDATRDERSRPGTQTGEIRRPPSAEGGAAINRGEANATPDRDRFRFDARQASTLRERLSRFAGAPSAGVSVNVRVGAPIPETVRLLEMPPEVIAEYPQFAGFDFVMIRDEIVIVDPRSREVVEVIGGGGEEGRAAAVVGERPHFSRDQDDLIRRSVRIDRSATIDFDERNTVRVPDTVMLEPLPDEVVAADPDFRPYRYFVDRDDHIVVVDPETHEVLEIID